MLLSPKNVRFLMFRKPISDTSIPERNFLVGNE